MSVEVYRSKQGEHASDLLKQLDKLWTSKDLCDAELTAGGSTFWAHKTVLAAASPYFRALYVGGLAKSDSDPVQVLGVAADVFENLLKFIYTGEVTVSTENCQDLLGSADMFELSEVVQACCDFLQQQLDPSNCIGIWRFADVHVCSNLSSAAENYFHNHFLSVTTEEEYLDISKELLLKVLESEYVRIENEFQVFEAAMKWILHDIPERRKHVFEIMAPVRFPIISHKVLDKYIDGVHDLSLKIALSKLVQDFRCFRRTPIEFKVSKLRPCLLHPRKCAQKQIYIVGGYKREAGGRWSDSQSLNVVERFDSFLQRWRTQAPLKHARSGHGIAVLNGKIFVAGGESDSLIFDNMECYDPTTDKWTMVASMTMPRCGLGICVMDNNIYALGGWIGAEIGDTIEKYDPGLNRWSVVDKVNTLRFAMGVVAHQGLIYVIGGMSEMGSECQTMESYNPVTSEWTRLANMSYRRANVGVAVLENYIYAVGGWNENKGALVSVERYCIEEDSWLEIPPMGCQRAGAAVGAVNGLLYVVGGRSCGNEYMAPSTLDTVECYDPQTESWLDVGKMPTSRCEAGFAVI